MVFVWDGLVFSLYTQQTMNYNGPQVPVVHNFRPFKRSIFYQIQFHSLPPLGWKQLHSIHSLFDGVSLADQVAYVPPIQGSANRSIHRRLHSNLTPRRAQEKDRCPVLVMCECEFDRVRVGNLVPISSFAVGRRYEARYG